MAADRRARGWRGKAGLLVPLQVGTSEQVAAAERGLEEPSLWPHAEGWGELAPANSARSARSRWQG
jgi:hypothetical protein